MLAPRIRYIAFTSDHSAVENQVLFVVLAGLPRDKQRISFPWPVMYDQNVCNEQDCAMDLSLHSDTKIFR